MSLEIFLASSCEMPCLRPTLSRNSFPEGFGSPGSIALSDTPRRTSLSLKTSRTALARSSLLARISTASPDQEIAAPTPRKSNLVLISLAAWFRALSTSCLSTLLTMSKNDSATPRSSLALARIAPLRYPDPARTQAPEAMHPAGATGMPGVRFPSLGRPVWRHEAGCPSGQRERSVKPSAKPTQVRTLDLPPIDPQVRPGLSDRVSIWRGSGLYDRRLSQADRSLSRYEQVSVL